VRWVSRLRQAPIAIELGHRHGDDSFSTFSAFEEAGPSPVSTTVQFAGSALGDSATGTLTFHRWRSAVTDDGMPVTWQGIASVNLVLR